MNLKSLSLITLFIFAAFQIVITCLGITLFTKYKKDVMQENVLSEYNNIFKHYGPDIAEELSTKNTAPVFVENSELNLRRMSAPVPVKKNNKALSSLVAQLEELSKNESVTAMLLAQNRVMHISGAHFSAGVNSNKVAKVFPVMAEGKTIGELRLEKNIEYFAPSERRLIMLSSIVPVLFLIIVLALIYNWTTRLIINPLQLAVEKAKSSSSITISQSSWSPIEIANMVTVINQLVSDVRDKSAHEARYELANQLAHDIRAPLSVIEHILLFDGGADHNQSLLKSAARRMQAIANDLLIKNRNLTASDVMQPENVYLKIHDILSEVRLLHADKGIEIALSCEDAKSAFAHVNMAASDFQRILSNLINNAVEALSHVDNPQVQISLSLKDTQFLLITIEDNGQGMSPEILAHVGERGFSTKQLAGGRSGSGLGVNFAMKKINEWGGVFAIDSEPMVGTEVEIALPILTETYFASHQLDVSSISRIVLIDDEECNMSVWQEKINRLADFGSKIEFIYHNSANEFESMMSYYRQSSSSTLFIFDNDLGNPDVTGVDLILKYDLVSYSLLASNRYSDYKFYDRLKNNKIKLLPKPLVGYFNLHAAPMNMHDQINQKPTVLVDDDSLVHLLWDYWATKNKIHLLKFLNSQDLFTHLDNIDPESEFFIDYHIKNDHLNGDQISQLLSERGYKNLNICTGDEMAIPVKPDYIKSVRGKSPPMA